MHISKKQGYLISSILLLLLTLITIFIILLFMHPTVYFSKASGFSKRDIVKAGKNKLRFVVPETVDVTKSTYISVKQEWFESSRIGKITAIKAKPNKYMAIDFTDRQYDSEVLTIYTKNWIGIKREYDVIIDYSNFLRVFFAEPYTGEAPRKPVILPYSKLQTEYKHIYEELYKIKSFVQFNKEGVADGQPVSREDVFTKENARGRAFIVDNSTHISLVYDFLLKGIFKNQTQKTQIIGYIDKTAGKFTTYDPVKQGIDIKFNTAPFYISKFLGWYYIDPAGNRIDLAPGQEVQIPNWVTSELRLIARYDITTDTDKIGPELDKQGLVAVSYFDGAQRVYFDIFKKGSPLKEYIYQKEGYTYAGWYKDSALTEKVDFTVELATTHTVLYLKLIKQNQPKPEKPVQYHNINFITPSDANQLFPTRRVHGQKLEINYLTPSLVSRLDEHGNLEELDYWNLVDPITGARTKYDFNTPITQDITLEAVMRKRAPLKTKYTIKKYFESVNQAGNFIEDKTKEEVVEGQTPGQEVELSPTQTNAPEGFTLSTGTQTKKKINKDGTTVFELKYTRNRYKVNFEVNYNGNHFKDVNASAASEQTVPHQGKLTKPTNPTITKAGYTYTFKHWQLKDEMGNVYKEITEFDFNTKITKNLTLVAYFTEEKQSVNYTINHVFEGVDDIAEKTEAKVHQALADSSKTVSRADRLTEFDEHFTVADQTQTQKINADGTTVFTLRYVRKTYTVNYEVNFNGTQFSGVSVENQPQSLQVKYQGKITKPAVDPKLTKAGYNYNFVQWQDKAQMNGTYNQIAEFDFANFRVLGETTLVAYITQNAKEVNYTINHVFEGVDDIAERTEAKTHQALADSSKTISRADRLTEFDEHFTVADQTQTQKINADGTTVFTLRYVRKTYTVTFEVNILTNQFPDAVLETPKPDSQEIKYEGKVRMPDVPVLTKEGYILKFVQWQDEALMNGVYTKVAGFNFYSSRVNSNITLVPYFEKTPKRVNYTIKHVLEGVDDTPEQIDARVHQEFVDKELTISEGYRLTQYDYAFTVEKQTKTQTIKADGSTVFTLKYKRRLYTISFELNYRRQFVDVVENNKPEDQTVKYGGKITSPIATPSLSKHGYTYKFIHWQYYSSMNGYYSKVSPINFKTTTFTRNETIVAYFEEITQYVNYKIVHYLEKRGPDNANNGQYERIEEIKKDQYVYKGATYSEYKGQHKWMYQADTTNPNNRLTAKLTADNHDTEVVQYYRLKEVDVYFYKGTGVEKLDYERSKVKMTRKVVLPGYTLTDGYEYLGWNKRGYQEVKEEYIIESTSYLELELKTTPKTVKITYTILSENIDGKTFAETKIYKTGKVGTMHYNSYEPDKAIYYIQNCTKDRFYISANENENEVVFTLKRHHRRVYFYFHDVPSPSYSFQEQHFYIHGQKIGEIDDTRFKNQGYEIIRYKIADNIKTKEEIENYIVEKEFNIDFIVDLPSKFMYKYPQNSAYVHGIAKHYKDDYREIKFKANGKDYTTNVKRPLYKDDDGNIYELFRGYYYKFEDVQFVKIPSTNFWTTRDIIDFAPGNLHHDSYSRTEVQHTLLNAWVKDIGKIMGTEAFLPTYDDTGEFSLKAAFDSHQYWKYFSKKPTEYARKMIEYKIYYKFNSWHDHDFTFASENGKAVGFYSSNYTHQYWWFGNMTNNSNSMLRIDDRINVSRQYLYQIAGVVVCVR